MKNRIKVTIAIVSGLAVIALIIGLASCNKKALPDISSSTATLTASIFIRRKKKFAC